MAKGFEIKINGLQDVQKILKQMPKRIREEVREEFKEAATETMNEMKRDVPVNQARLKNSLVVNVKGDLQTEIVAQSNYAAFVEFGTKSNADIPVGLETYAAQFRGPSGISDVDPLVALTAWVRRKGLAATYSTKRYDIRSRQGVRTSRNNAEAQRERSIAFLIWRKIKRFGIKAQPFFFRDKSGQSRLEKAKDRLIQRLKNIKIG